MLELVNVSSFYGNTPILTGHHVPDRSKANCLPSSAATASARRPSPEPSWALPLE